MRAIVEEVVIRAIKEERLITAAAIEKAETNLLTAFQETDTKAIVEDVVIRAIQDERPITAAAIENVETNLLTAFHEWASPTDQKIRSQREALSALDLQIEEIASRVSRLEARMDNPAVN